MCVADRSEVKPECQGGSDESLTHLQQLNPGIRYNPRMQAFDLIVIGSGPAGQRAAIQASKLGKTVALIEKREVVGGACINTGTIPSKTMREAVMHLSGYRYQGIYGMNYRVKERITMGDLSFRVQHVTRTEIDVTQAQLSRNGVEMLSGTGSFLDPSHIRVVSQR